MAEQYIFTIENLTKAYDKREVLKNIWLAFYPGAKIGVIGSNGAGKTTLLRIMAGQDTDFLGTARLTDGFTVGFVPQEPRLTPNKTVLDNVEEAVAGTRALLAKQEEHRQQDGRGVAGGDRQALRADGPGPGSDRRRRRLGPRPPSRNRHGRHAAAARRRAGRTALRRRTAARRPVQDAAAEARPAAARRADQPPRRRDRRLAGTDLAGVHRHGRRRHARPLLPRQRRPVDSGTGPRPGVSRARAITRRGWSRRRSVSGKEEKTESARQKTLARELEWAQMAPRARIAKSKARLAAYEKLASPGIRGEGRGTGHADSAGAAPGRPGRAGQGRQEGVTATTC